MQFEPAEPNTGALSSIELQTMLAAALPPAPLLSGPTPRTGSKQTGHGPIPRDLREADATPAKQPSPEGEVRPATGSHRLHAFSSAAWSHHVHSARSVHWLSVASMGAQSTTQSRQIIGILL
ncbi:hypothetical protein CH63R_11781 [Colletotrichum higginsianum IMI 349063]|uniref:Uncharacterized protein n=1 Tax=Colletotrichum higginsianum (strain IMI 349063) TaxID=759273 RepID=A0A1B7XZ71_COLHI|nr:hypothetical protein CH63R_11781 [Colletotrichum higginsianum IMI 349063]OBR05078.1 hypothetical protein CH63R_11781 [Colletotrichum higginsianum IMI 349063]